MTDLQFQKDAWLIGPSSDKYWGVGWTHRLQLRDKHIALELLVDCPAPKVSVEEWPSGLARPYSQARHYEAFFLVYDITSRASFEAVKAYQQNIVRERAISRSDCPECFRVECPPRPSFQGLTFVFANKIDRDQSQWQVSLEEGRQFADSIATSAESHATYFLPMSVKTGKGCSRADGEGIARRIILRRTQSPPFAHGRARHVETERVLSKREGPLHAYEDGWLYWY